MSEFKWKSIVRCAVRNAARLGLNSNKVSQSPYWHLVAELCGVGSSSAIELCEMFGVDPHAKIAALPTDANAKDVAAKSSRDILGIPEGRPGIWLIDANQAEALIHQKPGATIHNFIDGGMAMLGADWTKEQAVGLVHTEGKRSAVIFENTLKHQLVVIDHEKRWAFDIGEIVESRMKPKRCAVCLWPLKADAKDGCTAGNCSQRPVPTKPCPRIIDVRCTHCSFAGRCAEDEIDDACPDCGEHECMTEV